MDLFVYNLTIYLTINYLDELRSTNCRLERPTAVIIPNITVKIPPTIGLGIVRKKAPKNAKLHNVIQRWNSSGT